VRPPNNCPAGIISGFPPPYPYAVAVLLPLAEPPVIGTFDVLPEKSNQIYHGFSCWIRRTPTPCAAALSAAAAFSATAALSAAAPFSAATTTFSATNVLVSMTRDKRNAHFVWKEENGVKRKTRNRRRFLYNSTGPRRFGCGNYSLRTM